MFENKYPYTDFHELNLDWFLSEFKKVYVHVDDLDATVQQFTDFVTNYFNNLDVQEEINNKLNSMAADGSLSALIQPFFDEYKAQIDEIIEDQNADIATQNNRITTLESRMDSFVHLEEGSTTGDAELIDGRIGYKSETYTDIGNAIRQQTSFNDSMNNSNLADINQIKEDLMKEGTMNVKPIFQNGLFQLAGYESSPGNLRVHTQIMQPGIYTISCDNTYQFAIYTYVSDSEGEQLYTWTSSTSNRKIMKPFVITMRHTSNPNTKQFTDNELQSLFENMTISKKFGFYLERAVADTFDQNVLREFYLLDPSYDIYGVTATSERCRIRLTDANNQIVVGGLGAGPEYYDNIVQPFFDVRTAEIVGYFVVHYPGYDYSVEAGSAHFTANATDLDQNPLIKEYLGRQENIVLIGDSIMGYSNLNPLSRLLAHITNKKVYNCSFGGCRMSWRTPDGSSNYDKFTFVSIVDAIVNNDYTEQLAAMNTEQMYPEKVAALMDIDWTLPTTVYIGYVNNDITGDVPIGDLWEYTDGYADCDKQTFLGALNYGLIKLLSTYPAVKIIEMTSAYRKKGAGDKPPYIYRNALNLTDTDYNDAIKENAERIGYSVYDMFRESGRNYYNTAVYQVDESHYNIKGYSILAKIIAALDRSFKD